MCTRAVAVPLQARSSGAAVLWQGYRSAVATPMLWHCGNRSDKLYAASLPKLCKRFAKQTHELCDTMLRLALIKPTTKLQETTFWGLGLGGLQTTGNHILGGLGLGLTTPTQEVASFFATLRLRPVAGAGAEAGGRSQ